MFDSLNQSVTQAAFAQLVGRSEGRIAQLVGDGTLQPGASCLVWLRSFLDRLSEQAAGREAAGGLDLAAERAALAKTQREGLEIKNAVLRGQYASITLLADVLATASQAVSERFDHLPGDLKKACPQLDDAGRDAVVAVIAAARNEWVRATAELVRQRVAEYDEADEPELELQGPAGEPRAD